MALLLGEAVETIMGNHLYRFDGKVYRQVEGGPIGLELTGVVADLVMLWCDTSPGIRFVIDVTPYYDYDSPYK